MKTRKINGPLPGGITKTRTLAEAERHDLPEKSFRVSIEFALGCKSISVIQAKNSREARKRAQLALEHAMVSIDCPFEWDRGGIVGVSEPLDAQVLDVRETPNGLLNLDAEGVTP